MKHSILSFLLAICKW